MSTPDTKETYWLIDIFFVDKHVSTPPPLIGEETPPLERVGIVLPATTPTQALLLVLELLRSLYYGEDLGAAFGEMPPELLPYIGGEIWEIRQRGRVDL